VGEPVQLGVVNNNWSTIFKKTKQNNNNIGVAEGFFLVRKESSIE
jgi:hypothetical protein